jgi:hypothetical protein
VTSRCLAAGCVLLAAASCCNRRMLYEWRDEPYLRPVYARGRAEAVERMGSIFASERDIGCRALAVIGREALGSGDRATAREIARALMDHYRAEANLQIRSSILALCLRDVGAGDDDVTAFLEERLATYDMVAASAFALASLKPGGAYEAIERAYAMTLRARDHEHAYELLMALWLLGDARAVGAFEAALAELDRTWPAEIHHMKRPAYAKALAGRLETLRAAGR